jgi:GntR family transcriptional regulator
VTALRKALLLLPPLSAAAGGALYQQIVDGLKCEISEGRLAPGTPLPSFRGLAEELLVSVITVKRAYEELEREGLIYRRQGVGTFVSDIAHDRSREVKAERARALISNAVREGIEAGLTGKDLIQMLQDALTKPGASKHAKRA